MLAHLQMAMAATTERNSCRKTTWPTKVFSPWNSAEVCQLFSGEDMEPINSIQYAY